MSIPTTWFWTSARSRIRRLSRLCLSLRLLIPSCLPPIILTGTQKKRNSGAGSPVDVGRTTLSRSWQRCMVT
ncbi:hypothetical protein PpBr36_05096 [Pyricularia pennisetigena]|uniref:hypothetical protein n=1 Tax=Pyricularia pennisetigena TaxID=1578925 RepID=UPI00114F04A9|nr:hypothetical protein PpBr36_05096 [Pyricularia pennisetigena]TLS27105.1 hypothetical protein PpBr36_05096 [Pyricularia pennisetigena]